MRRRNITLFFTMFFLFNIAPASAQEDCSNIKCLADWQKEYLSSANVPQKEKYLANLVQWYVRSGYEMEGLKLNDNKIVPTTVSAGHVSASIAEQGNVERLKKYLLDLSLKTKNKRFMTQVCERAVRSLRVNGTKSDIVSIYPSEACTQSENMDIDVLLSELKVGNYNSLKTWSPNCGDDRQCHVKKTIPVYHCLRNQDKFGLIETLDIRDKLSTRYYYGFLTWSELISLFPEFYEEAEQQELDTVLGNYFHNLFVFIKQRHNELPSDKELLEDLKKINFQQIVEKKSPDFSKGETRSSVSLISRNLKEIGYKQSNIWVEDNFFPLVKRKVKSPIFGNSLEEIGELTDENKFEEAGSVIDQVAARINQEVERAMSPRNTKRDPFYGEMENSFMMFLMSASINPSVRNADCRFVLNNGIFREYAYADSLLLKDIQGEEKPKIPYSRIEWSNAYKTGLLVSCILEQENYTVILDEIADKGALSPTFQYILLENSKQREPEKHFSILKYPASLYEILPFSAYKPLKTRNNFEKLSQNEIIFLIELAIKALEANSSLSSFQKVSMLKPLVRQVYFANDYKAGLFLLKYFKLSDHYYDLNMDKQVAQIAAKAYIETTNINEPISIIEMYASKDRGATYLEFVKSTSMRYDYSVKNNIDTPNFIKIIAKIDDPKVKTVAINHMIKGALRQKTEFQYDRRQSGAYCKALPK